MVITRLSIEGGDRARRDSDSLLSTRGELIEAVEVGLETLSSPLSFASPSLSSGERSFAHSQFAAPQ